MPTKSNLCFIPFKSESFHWMIWACSEDVFVLHNNETIDSGFMVIEVSTVIWQFLLVVPNREWSVIFVENNKVVSIKLTYLSNIFIETFQSIYYLRRLSVPHIQSTIQTCRCQVPIMQFEYLCDTMCVSLIHPKQLSLTRIPYPHCAVHGPTKHIPIREFIHEPNLIFMYVTVCTPQLIPLRLFHNLTTISFTLLIYPVLHFMQLNRTFC
jgi:hypothetical protein